MGKCNCNLLYMVLGVVVLALGIFLFVNGLMMQWAGGDWLMTVVWYAVGLLVMCVGKMLKWKGCGSCTAHKMG